MTKTRKLITVLILSISALGAQAQIYSSPCSLSYSWDSYSNGVRAIFTQVHTRSPRFNDEACYQMGMQYGQSLLGNSSSSFCKNSFNRALSAGFNLVGNHNAGDACFTAGYNAGLAKLQTAARAGDEGVAGRRCVNAYNEGVSDFRSHMANDPTSFNSNVERHCYSQGYFEGSFH